MGLITTFGARLRGTRPEVQPFPTLSTTTMEEPT
jgi:hypothetical protein